jgi:hypothetical protein
MPKMWRDIRAAVYFVLEMWCNQAINVWPDNSRSQRRLAVMAARAAGFRCRGSVYEPAAAQLYTKLLELHKNMKNITKQFVLVAGVAFLLAGCSSMSPAPQATEWEYKTITTLDQDGEKALNSLGKNGWILVGFTYTPKSQTGLTDEYHYVFKRARK